MEPSGVGRAAEDGCLIIYLEHDLAKADDASFTAEHVWGACGAGAFPAAVPFRVTTGLPAELRSAFTKGTAVQFVYDKDRTEVVVYRAAS